MIFTRSCVVLSVPDHRTVPASNEATYLWRSPVPSASVCVSMTLSPVSYVAHGRWASRAYPHCICCRHDRSDLVSHSGHLSVADLLSDTHAEQHTHAREMQLLSKKATRVKSKPGSWSADEVSACVTVGVISSRSPVGLES